MKHLTGILLALGLLCTGTVVGQTAKAKSKKSTAGTTSSTASKPRKASKAKIQYGTASFYSNKFNGRPTATGELYDSKKFTAAHNGLPLGTWIKVTNLRNHKSVTVKINDRLHHKNPRLVDLSRAAAKKLGYTGHGLTRVKLEVLPDAPDERVGQQLK